MEFTLLSLFPDYFKSPLSVSLLARAQEAGLLHIQAVDIRDFAEGKHRRVDDKPFGGGPGMVLMAEPVVRALRHAKRPHSRTIYLSPQGRPLTPALCRELAQETHLILLCGHYEGIDERVVESEVDDEISIGDYVLSSGCPAAMVLIDAVARFIPGVVGKEESVEADSFQEGIFDAPHYTKPVDFEGSLVPPVLLSGHHEEIARFRKERAWDKTARVRPELINQRCMQ